MEYSTTVTQDGSPTLILMKETMHNIQGALGETVYVYGQAIDESISKGLDPSFLVIGMGMAYIEWMIFAKNSQANIYSFEANQKLKSECVNYLNGIHSELYHQTSSLVSEHFGSNVILRAREAYRSGKWQLDGAIDIRTRFQQKFSTILFDPFSKAESPELWDENFLNTFLEKATSHQCVFASYASTGLLKRTLKHAGFKILERNGFGKKRECTLAVRG